MPQAQLGAVARHLHRLLGAHQIRELSDAQLLQRFVTNREEDAFAVLVRRHGPLVLGVCRRVLRHEQDAEDAFQATFLTLARHAGSIRQTDAVGSWLYRVAHRIATKAGVHMARRKMLEKRDHPKTDATGSPAQEAALGELQGLLDEELNRLPEKYRAPFVLCCLEGKTRTEAARELGWKEGTVGGRLALARQMLQRRLTRRGVALPVALTALALTAPAIATLPVGLIQTTTKAALHYAAGGAAPAAVAAFLKGVSQTVLWTKVKIATAVLLAAGVAAACGLASAPGAPDEKPQASAKPQAAKDETAKDNDKNSITYAGRVLDPDGKPVAGASLYWSRLLREPAQADDDLLCTKKAATGADGHFELTLKPDEMNGGARRYLIAAADRFGIDWAVLPNDQSGELTLRLVKDAPIMGRILDSQGKPVAGARLHISSIEASGPEQLDKVLAAWKRDWRDLWLFYRHGMYASLRQVLRTASTDKDGRFTMRGVGGERLVTVELEGPMISNVTFYVITRSGFDSKPYNDAAVPAGRAAEGPLLYGPMFDFVATPSRVIEGNIRDQDTGKPIAGVRVVTGSANSTVNAVSDAEGHYRLAGLPKMDRYYVSLFPPKESNLLARWIVVPGADGLGPIAQDFGLARGVVVSGRIIDKSTGKGVRGSVRFAPLPENPFFDKNSYRQSQMAAGSDDQGNFRVVIIPGPGVLMARTLANGPTIDGLPVHTYPAAEFEPEDAKRVKVTTKFGGPSFGTAGNSAEFLGNVNAVKVVDFAEGAHEGTCDVYLPGAKRLKVRLEDPDGKPVSGAIVSGMTALWPVTFPIKEAECTLYGLDGSRQRRVLFYHPERKLSGHIIVRGNETKPVTVRLVPTGTVAGRLLDLDGQPLAGVEVSLSMPLECERELFRYVDAHRDPTKTDKDGRFRLDGVPPKLIFWLDLHQGRTNYVGEPKIDYKQVGSGKTLDLGDVRVKPVQ